MDRRGRASAASRAFAAVTASVLVVGVLVGALLVVDAQRTAHHEAETVSRAVAESIVAMPLVAEALMAPGATERLQPITDDILADASVDFITIMTPDGIRVTHPDVTRIGLRYLGTVPDAPVPLTEEYTGTLGASVRTIVPVVSDGALVGWVAAGVTLGSITTDLALPRFPFVVGVALTIVAAGIAGAVLARRFMRQVAGDLPADRIRDAVSSYESVRTLSQAMRAQTHEHGNRLHTAVALLELGRTTEAIAILTETSRRSQALLDRIDVPAHIDPAVTALLMGKASQARELGIEWTVEIDPDAPPTGLGSVDLVSVLGNLIDNALDAAASGREPRWVDASLERGTSGELRIVVSDSGDGVPDEFTTRVFEEGFSTKPVGGLGRGVGLPLVRSIVDAAHGSIELAPDAPTTFTVHLPAAEASA
ncbi:GHKL domain-containing protein [Pseudoclavibacter chungangensis]|uniref:histidine kinase n=1 Tax=Pseudoclavibacter chungangensis TaxID=587635 RepID=A0A7J5BQS5_9MICO|nr:ATP-binding protein [Pseudoclavibacter chungangensis]KAB1656367.1 GHKL domain-containing protein [Pseudoclavibacter chungangensis]NYJ67101.1 sensor histidine kinase regulating citrate/malate metabolism [Pseudoclavibacter chungangensis]